MQKVITVGKRLFRENLFCLDRYSCRAKMSIVSQLAVSNKLLDEQLLISGCKNLNCLLFQLSFLE